jgi:hypothetical protein
MRIRITVNSTGDRTNDLRVAANVRRDLWAHSPIEIDPDNPLYGTHRDELERAYFEFSTQYLEEVDRVLKENGHIDRVKVEQVQQPVGQACQNCGNIAGPVLPTVCPNCHFRDISACPVCHDEAPRQSYTRIGSDLFRCPHCRTPVHLRFNEPMFVNDGTYNEPLVVVEQAQSHEIQV